MPRRHGTLLEPGGCEEGTAICGPSTPHRDHRHTSSGSELGLSEHGLVEATDGAAAGRDKALPPLWSALSTAALPPRLFGSRWLSTL